MPRSRKEILEDKARLNEEINSVLNGGGPTPAGKDEVFANLLGGIGRIADLVQRDQELAAEFFALNDED